MSTNRTQQTSSHDVQPESNEAWICSSCRSIVDKQVLLNSEKHSQDGIVPKCAICIGLSDRITSIAQLCTRTIFDPVNGFQFNTVRINPVIDISFELREKLWALKNNVENLSIVKHISAQIVMATNQEN